MENTTTLSRFFCFAGIVLCAMGLLTVLYINTPELTPEERIDFKLPKNFNEAKRLGLLLSKYKDKHYHTVLFGIATVYILLQSFAIPGSIFLSVLSGYLFPFPLALFLVCTCSACGALMCYFLSYFLGRRLVLTYFPDRIEKWQSEVASVDGYLFFYMVFLRVTPILPNWFINLASPLIDVPPSIFFFGTFFGVAPPSFVFLQAGTTLQQITQEELVFSWRSILMITFSALISLIPIIYQQYTKRIALKQKKQ